VSAVRLQPPLEMVRRPVLLEASPLEASPPEVRARVEDVRLCLGITGAPPAESYGRTSAISEELLLRGYGLMRPRLLAVEP